MVFPFFKKNAPKPASSPSRNPRSRPAPAGEQFPEAIVDSPEEAGGEEAQDWDFAFTNVLDSHGALPVSYGIEVQNQVEPIEAEQEHAAILFANGQETAAQAALEQAIDIFTDAGSRVLWLMLFDLLRLSDQRSAFEQLSLRFAQTFEQSPPAWLPLAKPQAPVAGADQVVLQGVITGDSAGGLKEFSAAVDSGKSITVDFGRVAGVDAVAAARITHLLQRARRKKHLEGLLGAEGLAARLEHHAKPGVAREEALWLLLLELYQCLDHSQVFEDKAVDYAVTFELSPPSWESLAKKPLNLPEIEPLLDRYVLEGDVANCEFTELPDLAALNNPLMIECVALRRLDFVSATTLYNRVAALQRQGREFVFHHPNRLVAALLHVAGIDAVARIEFAKS
jgi:anti-anti-sigma regulatory factor